MKKWLSRGLVLAMIVAMMIPAPVLAKSSKGGYLLSSYNEYTMDDAGRWVIRDKVSYSYDKKNNPVEITDVEYNSFLLGVPVGGSKSVSTISYKYKGKTPKSAKEKDGAGFVTETRKYKKGKAVSISGSKSTSSPAYNEEGKYIGDDLTSTAEKRALTYNKYGLVTSSVSDYANAEKYADGKTESEGSNGAWLYEITQKKGIPSFILSYSGDGSEAEKDVNGNTWSVTYKADGSWTEVYNGETTTGKDTVFRASYTRYNTKGMAVESGTYTLDKETGKQQTIPRRVIDYTFKKGKVTEAVVNGVTTDENGVVTKVTPERKFKFKYNKKKISAVRYLSMINAHVGGGAGYFTWY